MAETNDRLRLLIERIERLEEEKKGIADDIREVYAEAKAVGFDPRIMRQIVRLRKMQADDRREMEVVLDLYKCELGMGGEGYARREPDPTPLEAAIAHATDAELAERGLVRIDSGERKPVAVVRVSDDDDDDDASEYDRAVEIVRLTGNASTSHLQRRLRIGYNAASALIERMEQAGIVGPPYLSTRKREVLAPAEPA